MDCETWLGRPSDEAARTLWRQHEFRLIIKILA